MGTPILKKRPARLSPSFVFRDVNHVLLGGQSLSTGGQGVPVVSTSQPYANKMFNTGVRAGGSGLTSFVPLVESPADPEDPVGEGETIASGMSSLVTKIAREQLLTARPEDEQSHDFLMSCCGIGGTAYSGLKKGTSAWTAMQAQVTAGKSISAGLGKSHVVRAVLIVHGETDNANHNTAYDDDLAEWQNDFDTDIRAITGQVDPVIMFHTQLSSWDHALTGGTTAVTLAQLAASVASAGKIVMVGPKYQFDYREGVHMTAESYRWLGEYYAKAYKRVILEGLPWEPVRPRSVVRNANVIDVQFHVPVRPLVLDVDRVANPGSYGFRFKSDGTPPAITNVKVTSDTTVRITLASTPSAANQRLTYALNFGADAGPNTGSRGCLRDSDPTVSRNGKDLFNWCVHFDEPVTS